MEHKTIYISQREMDWIFVVFFPINFFSITCIVDIGQSIVPIMGGVLCRKYIEKQS